MSEDSVEEIRSLLARCSVEERQMIFNELRSEHQIHPYEAMVGAPAEMILEAVYRAPELTRRMLRGVIADAAFRTFAMAKLVQAGWKDVTPDGNHAFDYSLDDGRGPITVQVKLQRSERGSPVTKNGARYGFPGPVFLTETQKTRTGTDGVRGQTRPYRYGEFDVLAVSMQPSSQRWDSFRFTLGRWLITGKRPGEIATFQPVTMEPGEFWTDDFQVAALWFRNFDAGKRLVDTGSKTTRKSAPEVASRRTKARKSTAR
jgi:hypothetical protein